MKIKRVLGVISMLLVSGCSILNPYNSEPQCPNNGYGKCNSVSAAYDEEKNGTSSSLKSIKGDMSSEGDEKKPVKTEVPRDLFKKAIYQENASLIQEETTPIIKPAKSVRVELYSYSEDGKTLWMPRHAYFIVEEPRFLMGNYLNQESDDKWLYMDMN